MSKETEMKYLKEKLSEVRYKPDRFTVFCGEDKFIFGFRSANGVLSSMVKLMQYKTIYSTLVDLDWKVKHSFNEALKYAYSEQLQKDFSILQVTVSEEEKLAFYYVENALFRTLSSWDMLAQLYRLYYDINVAKEKVYYKQIFDPEKQYCVKFLERARKIKAYFEQENDTDCEGMWRGNHSFVNDLRNKMTHRNSPNVAVMSDFDVNFKLHPCFLIKRIIEDYTISFVFIREILDDIEKEIIEAFD